MDQLYQSRHHIRNTYQRPSLTFPPVPDVVTAIIGVIFFVLLRRQMGR